MSKFIATFAYVGLIPIAPGTFGSLAALPFGYAIAVLAGPLALILVSLLVFGAGYWATVAETAGSGNHDPSEIVIDEVVGQFLAMLPLAFGAFANSNQLIAVASAFVLFRIFDILKPFPISWADGLETPFGVMLDDVLAGLAAALCVLLISQFLS